MSPSLKAKRRHHEETALAQRVGNLELNGFTRMIAKVGFEQQRNGQLRGGKQTLQSRALLQGEIRKIPPRPLRKAAGGAPRILEKRRGKLAKHNSCTFWPAGGLTYIIRCPGWSAIGRGTKLATGHQGPPPAFPRIWSRLLASPGCVRRILAKRFACRLVMVNTAFALKCRIYRG